MSTSATIHPEGVPEIEKEKKDAGVEDAWPPSDLMEKSLFCISKDNALRKICIDLAAPSTWFDTFILVCIIANSLIMAMTDYSHVKGMDKDFRDKDADKDDR